MSNVYIKAIKEFIEHDLIYCRDKLEKTRIERMNGSDDSDILLGLEMELSRQKRNLESYIRLCNSFIKS